MERAKNAARRVRCACQTIKVATHSLIERLRSRLSNYIISIPIALGIIALTIWWIRKKSRKVTPKTFLDGANSKKSAPILEIENVSHDTKRFRIGLPTPDMKLGLPTGKHIIMPCPNPTKSRMEKVWNGVDDTKEGDSEVVERKYTPVTNDETTSGYADLIIKMYRPGKVKMPDGREISWSDGGKMSRHLDSLKVGDSLDMRGPVGLIQYFGRGIFRIPGNPKMEVEHVGMLAGGTGITPMLQILQASLADDYDRVKFSLIYANKMEDDILVRDRLDRAQIESNGRIKVHYTLDFPPEDWPKTYSSGFITTTMIKAHLPPPAPKTLIMMCGPPPMVEFACKANLHKLEYPKAAMATF
eukprot:GEMP01048263.1.p1 GENE.GEMP01048263.1~~GEMP01048263.1.p1  ORF type:complete len:357 (+),score=52.22 GEMP01048263.1:123-1193(+)